MSVKKSILIATGNPGKAKELKEALGSLEDQYKFLSLKDFPQIKDVEENEPTFEANALIKAKYFATKHNIAAVADDSGFILDAYPDRFGVRTKRELEAKDDMDWMTQFLDIIEPLENRRATFYCAMAYYNPETKEEEVFLGVTEGVMMEFPQTPLEKGIPVSSVFLPDGLNEVFSAMTKKQKNDLSHRGKACKMLCQFLSKN